MAGGWAREGAVQEQIDATVDDAVARARSTIGKGESERRCRECGESIPEARRQAVPGVKFCLDCQESMDQSSASASGYNRRGSKDSQLR